MADVSRFLTIGSLGQSPIKLLDKAKMKLIDLLDDHAPGTIPGEILRCSSTGHAARLGIAHNESLLQLFIFRTSSLASKDFKFDHVDHRQPSCLPPAHASPTTPSISSEESHAILKLQNYIHDDEGNRLPPEPDLTHSYVAAHRSKFLTF
jgi:hypothetical protein